MSLMVVICPICGFYNPVDARWVATMETTCRCCGVLMRGADDAIQDRASGAVDHTMEVMLSRATEALGSREKALYWVDHPNGAMGGVTPRVMAGTKDGIETVLAVLRRIKFEVFG